MNNMLKYITICIFQMILLTPQVESTAVGAPPTALQSWILNQKYASYGIVNSKFSDFRYVTCFCETPRYSYSVGEAFAGLDQYKIFCQECGCNSDTMMLHFIQVYLRDYIKKGIHFLNNDLAIQICFVLNSFSYPEVQPIIKYREPIAPDSMDTTCHDPANVPPKSIASLIVSLGVSPLSTMFDLYNFDPENLQSFRNWFSRPNLALKSEILAIIDEKIWLEKLLGCPVREFYDHICDQKHAKQLSSTVIYRLNDSFMNRFGLGELITLLEKILTDKHSYSPEHKHILLDACLLHLNSRAGELTPENQYRLIEVLIYTHHFSQSIYFYSHLQFHFKEDQIAKLIALFYQSCDINSDECMQRIQMLHLWAYIIGNNPLMSEKIEEIGFCVRCELIGLQNEFIK